MNFWLAIHICAGIVCDVTESPESFPSMLLCAVAAERTLAHVKEQPEAYRFIVRGAPGEIKLRAYACVKRVD